MELTGAQVRRVLEQQYDGEECRAIQVSGLRFAHDPSKPEGRQAAYTAAVTKPLADGGSEFTTFTEGRNVRIIGKNLEILTEYVDGMSRPFEAPDPEEQRRIKLAG